MSAICFALLSPAERISMEAFSWNMASRSISSFCFRRQSSMLHCETPILKVFWRWQPVSASVTATSTVIIIAKEFFISVWTG